MMKKTLCWTTAVLVVFLLLLYANANSVLDYAVYRNYQTLTNIALFMGADVKKVPLHSAVRQENLEVIERLLRLGADVNGKIGEWEITPLHIATGCGKLEAAKLLVSHGADVNAKAKDDWTPLHLIAIEEHPKPESYVVAEYLISAGADVNARDKKGRTPLHYTACGAWFCCYEWKTCAVFFVTHGADVYAKDNDGLTTRDLAEESKNKEMVEYLSGKMDIPQDEDTE